MHRKSLSVVVCLSLLAGCAQERNRSSPAPSDEFVLLTEACRLCAVSISEGRVQEALARAAPPVDLQTFQRIAEQLGCCAHVAHSSPSDVATMACPALALTRRGSPIILGAIDQQGAQAFVVESSGRGAWIPLATLRMSILFDEGVVLLRPKAPTNGPRLWTQREAADLGTFSGGRIEKRIVTVINVGDRPLQIRSIAFSCSCARLDVADLSVASNSAAKLPVYFDMSSKPQGGFTLSASIESNDPSSSPGLMSFEGIVKFGVTVSPHVFAVGEVPPTEVARTLQSKVRFHDGRQVRLEPGQMDSGVEWDSCHSEVDGSRRLRLLARFGDIACDDNGQFIAHASVASDHADYPVLRFAIVGRRIPWLATMPQSVYVGVTGSDATIQTRIKVTSFLNGPLALEVADKKLVDANVSHDYIYLTVRTPAVSGLYETSIALRDGNHRVVVPIIGVVR